MENKNVPPWILTSTTGIEKQNDEVGLIIAEFIGTFRKRGFTESEIGLMLAPAFLLPLEEVTKRIDEVLSICDTSEKGRKMCIFAVTECGLFDNTVDSISGIVETLKNMI